MTPNYVTPVLAAALVFWLLYRRSRRLFGRQRIDADRLLKRARNVGLMGCLIAAAVGRDLHLVAALSAGAACGALLAYASLGYTSFEVSAEGRFYTPQAPFGILIMALLTGRLVYHLLEFYSGADPAAFADPLAARVAADQHAPLTIAVLGILVGYHLTYYLGVLRRTKTVQPGVT